MLPITTVYSAPDFTRAALPPGRSSELGTSEADPLELAFWALKRR